MSLGCLRIISTTLPLSISGDVVSLRFMYSYGTTGWLNPFKLTDSWALNLKSFSHRTFVSGATNIFWGWQIDSKREAKFTVLPNTV